MAEEFFKLDNEERGEVLQVAASASGRPIYLLEKDIWVVWALSQLFTADFGQHLVFKGGTALSKAYDVIQRFSEDVDLTYDIYALAPDLVGELEGIDPIPETRSQRRKLTDAIRKELLPAWINGTALPYISSALAKMDGVKARADECNVYIEYEPLVPPSKYAIPRVKLEFGARSSGEPSTLHNVVCDAATYVENVTFPTATPRVMNTSRIFWEKATAAHVYCLQGESGISQRFSRHFFDLAKLEQAGYVEEALAQNEVAQAVAIHKNAFFEEKDERQTRIDYIAAVTGSIRLMPSGSGIVALRKDYEAMIADGLLFEEAQPFDQLMLACSQIQEEINAAMKAT
jgi:hypothetical protein